MRILLAEDNQKLGNLISHMLKQEKFQVDWVDDGNLAYACAIEEEYDILILDWMLPGKSGVKICRALREQGYQKGILILTARDAVEDRVMGLSEGADDYLIKPFEFEELKARIQALGRRNDRTIQSQKLKIGDLILDRVQKRISCKGEEVQLSPREFELLEFLAENKGQTVPKELILDRIWGWEKEIRSNSVESYIKILRKKLKMSEEKGVMIHTVRGIGYRLEETDV